MDAHKQPIPCSLLNAYLFLHHYCISCQEQPVRIPGPGPRTHDNQPHICALNHGRNGQTQLEKICGTPALETFLPYLSYLLWRPHDYKNKSAFPAFYLCCMLQGEANAISLLPLHFRLKYIKLNREGKVKNNTS